MSGSLPEESPLVDNPLFAIPGTQTRAQIGAIQRIKSDFQKRTLPKTLWSPNLKPFESDE